MAILGALAASHTALFRPASPKAPKNEKSRGEARSKMKPDHFARTAMHRAEPVKHVYPDDTIADRLNGEELRKITQKIETWKSEVQRQQAEMQKSLDQYQHKLDAYKQQHPELATKLTTLQEKFDAYRQSLTGPTEFDFPLQQIRYTEYLQANRALSPHSAPSK